VVVTPGGRCGAGVADSGVVVRGVLPGMAWPAPVGVEVESCCLNAQFVAREVMPGE
jgi:hypothetical protein